jgi:uncharacterized membrane protein YfcA
MTPLFYFFILLFIIAFLYSAVGHGGASGYLALMALFSFEPNFMKPTALILNLFVSLLSFIIFYRAGYFKWKIFLPLALASIPFAYLGGTIELDGYIYKKVLGLLLLIPILRFFIYPNTKDFELKNHHIGISLLIGATIGFLSGLIGIGGGILLSPLLLLLKWTNQKQTAALSALFIFVNSASGLVGQFSKGIIFENDMLTFVAIAVVGGAFGAWFGAKKWNQTILKYVLASVLILASIKLLLT